MSDPWPWPADDALTRARTVGREYRARLEQVAPELCAEVDAVVARLGQTWASGRDVSGEQVLTTNDAASYLAITPRGVRLAVQRGGLRSAGQDADGYLFHRSDLNAYLTRRARVVAERAGSPVPSRVDGRSVSAG